MKSNKGLIFIAFLSPLMANAQVATDSIFHLDEVVVTGTRTPKLLKDAPIQTRLITALDIQKTDATNLQDLLQQELPGVEFSYAMNQQINMNVSGFGGQGVLILVDGERLAGETMDNVDFSRLNMSNVARIEIIKGAASALYGSNAVGGVINIITKEADQRIKVGAHARIADHNEQRYGGNVGFRMGKFSNTLDVQHTTIDTYQVCSDLTDECQFRHVYGNRTWNFQDKITVRPVDNLKLTGHAGYFFKERYYNIDTPDRYRSFTGGARGDWALTEKDRIELSYNYDQYDKSDYQRINQLDLRDYSNVQHTVRGIYSRAFREKDMLTVGGDYMRDYLDSYSFSDGAKHQYSADAFAQYDWTVNDRWEVVGATRWDYFSDGNDQQVTGKLSARYNAGNWVFRGGYASGFRAPSLKERYMKYDMQGAFWIIGNKNLVPEKSHNFNLGAEFTYGHYNFTVSASYNLVKDKLTNTSPLYDSQEMYNYVQYVNVDKMQVLGVEATAQAKWDNGVGARLSYNFTHEEVVGASVNQYSPARPHALNAKVEWNKQWNKHYGFHVALTGRFLSAVSYKSVKMAYPFPEYEITNPGYAICKLQLINRFSHGINLTLAVDNLLNYRPKVYYYNSPTTTGANFMAGISWDL